MSEKLCLKWNDFQENVNTAFGSLRQDKDFTDVTLACGDGQQIEAHKVILAASSPFFQNLLNKNTKKQHHPLVYMKREKNLVEQNSVTGDETHALPLYVCVLIS